MAFETGTAADSNALFALFRTFITTNVDLVAANQHWEELDYNEDDSDTAQLYLRGKGLADSDSIYVNMYRFLEDIDSFNWGFRGATGYLAGNDYTLQPGVPPRSTYILLHNTTLNYWFFANGRRFIIVVKVGGTVYQSAYCGFINQYDLPTEFPYPLLINASSSDSDERFSWIGSNNHTSLDRGSYTTADAQTNAWIINAAGQWDRIRSYDSITTANTFIPAHTAGESLETAIWPYLEQNNAQSGPNKFLPAPGDEYVLRRLIAIDNRDVSGKRAVYGSYDDVFQVSGAGNAAENTLTIGGDTYIVFPNIYRSDIGDYFAVKQG
jgi:hypothetical protein